MMHVDPFRLAIALVPLAAYLLLLALVNLRRRPFLTSGGSDLAALGVALSGLAFVGPIELFRPEAATTEFGNYIWPMMLVFYWLWVLLAVLIGRPRLVVYNVSVRRAASGARRSGVAARSRFALGGQQPVTAKSGRAFALGIVRLDAERVARFERQPAEPRRLARAGPRSFRQALKPVRVKPNPRGVGFLLLALALMAGSLTSLVSHPKELAYAVKEVFAY